MRIDYPRRGRTGIRHWLPSWRQLLALATLGVVLVFGAFVAAYAAINVPSPNELSRAQSSIVYFADGKNQIGQFATVDRQSVPLSDVPASVRYAVLAAEDRTFYENNGISVRGTIRALWNDLRGGATQGGSTITQQYAKNAYLTQDRTLSRKLKEFVLALKLDRSVSKDQILQNYLNTIYFGRGAYGIEAAARAYFHTSASQLSLRQGAFLAALIQAPSYYDPANGPEAKAALAQRFGYVLDGMVAEGWLDPAKRQTITVPTAVDPASRNALGGPRGYLLEYVRRELLAKGFTDQQIDTGGLRIVTTFDYQAQRAAVQAMRTQFPTVNVDQVHAGLAAVQPGTGRIVAMYGGKDYVSRPLNDASQALIQGGSTFKAFTLASAFENGVGLYDTFDGNSPLTLPGLLPVRNEFNQSYGTVSLLTATEQSINTAFVQLTMQLGAQKVYDSAIRAGIPKDTPGLMANARVTLGTASTNPLDLASAYATFAARGTQATPFSVTEVRGANRGLLYRASVHTTQPFTSSIADDVTYALQQVVLHGTGTNAQALGRPAAGKTGTAEDKSAWFVGYTPQIAAAVGFYRGDKTPLSLDGVGGMSTFFGGEYPTRIWTAFMQGALQGDPVETFSPPTGIQTAAPSPATTSPSPSATASTPSGTPTPTSTPTPSTTPTPTGSPSGSGSPAPSGSGSPSATGASGSPT